MSSAGKSGNTAVEAVFLSDLHLKTMKERNGQTLLRFLHSLESAPPGVIFLLGDVFDLWVSDHRVFVRRFEPLLKSLQRLREKDVRITYFEGNHDMHLAPYWKDVLGAEVYTGAAVFNVGGLRIRCEHGDEINLEDLAYLRLRAFLRHPVVERAAHALPGVFWDFLGKKWSAHSRKISAADRERREGELREMIRRHGEKVWSEDPFDAIISGHMHVRDDWTFERGDRKVRSINLGSWFEDAEVLVLKDGVLEWRKL